MGRATTVPIVNIPMEELDGRVLSLSLPGFSTNQARAVPLAIQLARQVQPCILVVDLLSTSSFIQPTPVSDDLYPFTGQVFTTFDLRLQLYVTPLVKGVTYN
jgi:hypothetical protein